MTAKDRRLVLSRRQEKSTAKVHGGRQQPRSGAGWVHKNDVRTDRFLIENKHTSSIRSITIKAEDLRKVRINATRIDRVGLLEFHLDGHDYVVLHRTDFLGYVDE